MNGSATTKVRAEVNAITSGSAAAEELAGLDVYGGHGASERRDDLRVLETDLRGDNLQRGGVDGGVRLRDGVGFGSAQCFGATLATTEMQPCPPAAM